MRSCPAVLGGRTLDELISELEPSKTYAPFPAKNPA
ncbi:hypothetical protein SAMN05444173_0308 [Opitutus sp. GAS368]|jgi:hypothetical protein|nr:hypothetical protein SAMN05444173_0308 [Opitutus sp. GAS368]